MGAAAAPICSADWAPRLAQARRVNRNGRRDVVVRAMTVTQPARPPPAHSAGCCRILVDRAGFRSKGRSAGPRVDRDDGRVRGATMEPMTTTAAGGDRQVPFATDGERWTAVLRRDPGADGAFYFSVRTTGVYCRPSCGARQPLRRNVAFHA